MPNFIISTDQASLIHIDPSGDEDNNTVVYQGVTAEVHAIAVRPGGNIIALASYSGALQLWNSHDCIQMCACQLHPHWQSCLYL